MPSFHLHPQSLRVVCYSIFAAAEFDDVGRHSGRGKQHRTRDARRRQPAAFSLASLLLSDIPFRTHHLPWAVNSSSARRGPAGVGAPPHSPPGRPRSRVRLPRLATRPRRTRADARRRHKSRSATRLAVVHRVARRRRLHRVRGRAMACGSLFSTVCTAQRPPRVPVRVLSPCDIFCAYMPGLDAARAIS